MKIYIPFVLKEKVFILPFAVLLSFHIFHLKSMMGRASFGLLPIPKDQTLYLQIFENMLNLRGSGASILGMDNLFSNHFSPVFALLLPVYAVIKLFFSLPHNLLFMSFLLLFSGGAVLLYLAGRLSDRNIWIVSALAVMWAGAGNLNYLASGGFRETYISWIPLGMMIYAFEKNHKKEFVIFSLLLLLIREDYGLILFGFSLASIKKDAFWKIFPVSGLFVFFLLMIFVIPAVNPSGGFTGSGRFSHLGGGFSEIVFSPFTKPSVFFGSLFRLQNYDFFRDLLYPFCFLPLIFPRLLIPLAPYVLMLLLDNFALVPASSVVTWYAAPIAPFTLMASAAALIKLWDRVSFRRTKVIFILAVPLIFLYRQSPVFSTVYYPDPGSSLNESVNNLKSFLPENSRIVISHHLSPFFGDFEHLVPFAYSEDLPGDHYLILARDLSNPGVWQDCCSREEYRDLVMELEKKYARRISYSDENLSFFVPGSEAAAKSAVPRPPEDSWEEAEFAGSEFFYNISLSVIDGEVSRSLSGVLPGITGKRSAGNALVGGVHSGRGLWRFTVKMKGEIPSGCGSRKNPELIIRNMNSIFYSEEFSAMNETHFIDRAFYFTMPDDSYFFPVIRYRRCGTGWLDKYKLERVTGGP